MKKIVINTSYGNDEEGGFCLSYKAFRELREQGQRDALQEPDLGAHWPAAASPDEPSLNRCGKRIPRDDAKLVAVVERLGAAASGHAASLKVVEIPDDVKWEIGRIDGVEHVSEAHRRWS